MMLVVVLWMNQRQIFVRGAHRHFWIIWDPVMRFAKRGRSTKSHVLLGEYESLVFAASLVILSVLEIS